MSLDVYIYKKKTVYDANITHNLNKMAEQVKIGDYTLYLYLWRPEEIDVFKARQLIKPLKEAYKELKDNPEKYRQYDAENGWGKYENLLEFVAKYREACKRHPDYDIEVSR